MKQSQSMSVLTSMATGRWFTPCWYLDLVREVFRGPIDLDPASCASANRLVKANMYYTDIADGLTQPWNAKNVFLNPPYTVEGVRKAYTSKWIDKALEEFYAGRYSEGIYLVNAKLGYKWFNNLLDSTGTLVLLHRHRIGFVDPLTMEEDKPSRQPQASIYVGPHANLFRYVIGPLGWVI